MRFIQRRPQFRVTMLRPDYQNPARMFKPVSEWAGRDRVHFVARAPEANNESNALVSYEYKESLQDVMHPFSMELTLERDPEGNTWLDKIEPRDMVQIEEFGRVRYVGFVNRINYTSRMSDEGPNRSISVSGFGFGGLLASFSILLDLRYWSSSTTAEAASTQLKTTMASTMGEQQPLYRILHAIYETFLDLVEKVGKVQPTYGLRPLFDTYLDYTGGMNQDVISRYPMALSLFQTGQNNVWALWQQVLTRPLHELFGYWEHDLGKYRVVMRQTPFEPADWTALPIHEIDPVLALGWTLGRSDDEVYTFYSTTVTGSQISREMAIAIDEYRETAVIDEERWASYGFRPLETSFAFFNRSEIRKYGPRDLMELGSELMYNWYRNNPDFYNGSLELMTTGDLYPRIGERVGMLGAEFYVTDTTRSWRMGGQMRSNIAISRGFVYDANGNQVRGIPDVGRKLRAFEEDGTR